jgi:hypothetical protein
VDQLVDGFEISAGYHAGLSANLPLSQRVDLAPGLSLAHDRILGSRVNMGLRLTARR